MFTMLGSAFRWWLRDKSNTCLIRASDNYEVLLTTV